MFISCSDQKRPKIDQKAKNSYEWKEYTSKDSIPELLYLALSKVTNQSFDIANPNEKWQQTDVIWIDSLPTRQLKFVSNMGNEWRIAYEQGGFGKHYIYAQCRIENDTLSHFKATQTILKIINNDSVNKFLSEGKLKL